VEPAAQAELPAQAGLWLPEAPARTGGAGGKGGSTTELRGTTSSGGSAGPRVRVRSGLAGPLSTGIIFIDTDGKPVNAHGGGIIKVGDTFYMHGEFFLYTAGLSKEENNSFHGFSMYSSKDLATWKNEGIILPQQPQARSSRQDEMASGRIIIKCPATGEFVLYAHAATRTIRRTRKSSTRPHPRSTASTATRGSSPTPAERRPTTATWVPLQTTRLPTLSRNATFFTLANDCHSWLSDKQYSAINCTSGGSEIAGVFKANGTYYWIGSKRPDGEPTTTSILPRLP